MEETNNHQRHTDYGSGEPVAHPPDGFYVLIWVGLLALTQFTVLAGQMRIGALGTVIALLVTPAKASLILLYFMHLRYEKPVFRYMFVFALFALMVAIALTFADYRHR